MGEDADESVASSMPAQFKFTSIKSPDYRREFINGTLSNITPRGEIVCDFYFESRDMPTEQVATPVGDGSGKAKLSPFRDPGTFTRDVKFGIIINVPFAKALVELLNDKIKEKEGESEVAEKAKHGDET
jgi:hypothetical protein